MRAGDTVVVDGELSLITQLDGESGIVTKVVEHDLPYYSGPVVVTPTRETQILNTADKVNTQNITINPIPQNYGLITWNGSTLTVS